MAKAKAKTGRVQPPRKKIKGKRPMQPGARRETQASPEVKREQKEARLDYVAAQLAACTSDLLALFNTGVGHVRGQSLHYDTLLEGFGDSWVER
jgi:hypothetical protein